MNRFITALLLILITSVNLYAKTKTKKYKDGSIYVGEWKYNIPYGEGVLTLKDGTTISGNWQKGKFQGYGSFSKEKYDMGSPSNGVISYPDGRVFTGEISSLKPSEGLLQYPNGDTFTGSFYGDNPSIGKYSSVEWGITYSLNSRYNPPKVEFSDPKYGTFNGTLSYGVFRGDFKSRSCKLSGEFRIIKPHEISIVYAQGNIGSGGENGLKEGKWINDVFSGTSYSNLHRPFKNKGNIAECKEFKNGAIVSVWYLVPSHSYSGIYYSYREEKWNVDYDYFAIIADDSACTKFKGGELTHPVKENKYISRHYKGNYVKGSNNNILEDGYGECKIWRDMKFAGNWKDGEPVACKGSHERLPIEYSLEYKDSHLNFSISSSRGTKRHSLSGGLNENILAIYNLFKDEVDMSKKARRQNNTPKSLA